MDLETKGQYIQALLCLGGPEVLNALVLCMLIEQRDRNEPSSTAITNAIAYNMRALYATQAGNLEPMDPYGLMPSYAQRQGITFGLDLLKDTDWPMVMSAARFDSRDQALHALTVTLSAIEAQMDDGMEGNAGWKYAKANLLSTYEPSRLTQRTR